ncbi:MAG: methyl-accepting chemotaxis protein [Desulfobacteraceae bacterium]|nr:methyl-accepting chemotaxis protein [Desulfobacteraceae bacterium]
MKMYPFRLKHKISGMIIIILTLVMVVSTLVVSFLIYRQNMNAAYENNMVAIQTVKTSIRAYEDDLKEKTGQMGRLFKAGQNLKFIVEYKDSLGLDVTRKAFSELVRAIGAMGSDLGMERIALYDEAGMLIAFSEKKESGRISGFYYVNPKPGFAFTLAQEGADLSQSQWKEAEELKEISYLLQDKALVSENTSGRFFNQDKKLGMRFSVPVMEASLNPSGQTEQKRYGYLIFHRLFDSGLISRMAGLTKTDLNLFARDELFLGNLPGYTRLDLKSVQKTAASPWRLEDQAPIRNMVRLDQKKYIQAVLPVYSASGYAGAFCVLKSGDLIRSNTLQVVLVLVATFVGCLLLIVPVSFFFAGTIVKPIEKVTESLKDVAQGEGDLTRRIEIRSKDEIGDLSMWFNMFIEKLQHMVADIAENTKKMTGSVVTTDDHSEKIVSNASTMLDLTRSTTEAAGLMSRDVSSIARVMEEATGNLNIIASSTEEMTATVNEIAKNASEAKDMSTGTAQKISTASESVIELGKVADDIDACIESINTVSEQTKLLALNATIEAARAGEAGKGFAVVAGEIKTLANQVALVTLDIKEKIDKIKSSSGRTSREMKTIVEAFNHMDDIITNIAGAIEEQSVTTNEIAANTTKTASGVTDVNERISGLDQSASGIARDMDQLNASGSHVAQDSGHIRTDMITMRGHTQKLEALVGKFVIRKDTE